MTDIKVLTVFGTRPEAIKMAPVVRALEAAPGMRPVLCLTGQHRHMLAGVIEAFGLKPDYDLSIMKPEQDLAYITAAVLGGLGPVLTGERPDWVLVHGDTTSAMAAALAAFYAGCRIAHVEAGLRTGDLSRPWPEEMNRSVIDRLADLRFAPTETARDNLLRENIRPDSILVTGNTVVDALEAVCARLRSDRALRAAAAERFAFLDPGKRLVLVTGHRRESFGAGFERICRGLSLIARRGDVEIVYPIHLNPRVRGPVMRILGGLPNVHLIEPLDYVPFVHLMMRSELILTDSGGIQEEAPSLGKTVLVMRDVTERPEVVESGAARLVGTDAERIGEAAAAVLDAPPRPEGAAMPPNPYGDGRASSRIVDALREFSALRGVSEDRLPDLRRPGPVCDPATGRLHLVGSLGGGNRAADQPAGLAAQLDPAVE
jgi:UDP-N-acetylglucosamine 2-epimerase (non-hydrolysing)